MAFAIVIREIENSPEIIYVNDVPTEVRHIYNVFKTGTADTTINNATITPQEALAAVIADSGPGGVNASPDPDYGLPIARHRVRPVSNYLREVSIIFALPSSSGGGVLPVGRLELRSQSISKLVKYADVVGAMKAAGTDREGVIIEAGLPLFSWSLILSPTPTQKLQYAAVKGHTNSASFGSPGATVSAKTLMMEDVDVRSIGLGSYQVSFSALYDPVNKHQILWGPRLGSGDPGTTIIGDVYTAVGWGNIPPWVDD